jgi:hypothetical protein
MYAAAELRVRLQGSRHKSSLLRTVLRRLGVSLAVRMYWSVAGRKVALSYFPC